MTCSIAQCENAPHLAAEWKTENLPLQNAVFCKEHSDEWWDKLKGLVALNRAWVAISEPRSVSAAALS